MGRYPFDVDRLQPVHAKKMGESGKRVISQVFVVDRVVLKRIDQGNQVMIFRNENTVIDEQGQDSFYDIVDVFDMGKTISGRD